MAVTKKLGFPSNMVNFTLRLPPELRKELDVATDFQHAKDPTELVRGWIREEVVKLNRDPRYRKLKEKRLAAVEKTE